jgi:membrane-associated phospholipid phosphatase
LIDAVSQSTDTDKPSDPESGGVSTEQPLTRRRRLAAWAGMRKSILIRFGIAIVVVSVIALLNSSFLGWGTFVTAAILAVPASRFRAYTAAFLPYGLVWLVFSLLRSLADETAIPLRTAEVTAIERAMFNGVTPTIWLQEHLFTPGVIHWYDYATTFVHWSYFFIPHVAAILIWRKSPALYNRFLLTTMITLFVGLLVYFLSPAAPPWLTADAAPQTDIFRVMVSVGRNINSSLFDRTYGVLGDPNPVAAMPSLHMAITFMLFWFARHHSRWLAGLAFLYAMAMAFSLVYTGEHYVIDVLVGSAITTYAYFFAGRWLNVTAPFFGGVTQPTLNAANNPGVSTAPPRSVVRDATLRDERQREEPA